MTLSAVFKQDSDDGEWTKGLQTALSFSSSGDYEWTKVGTSVLM